MNCGFCIDTAVTDGRVLDLKEKYLKSSIEGEARRSAVISQLPPETHLSTDFKTKSTHSVYKVYTEHAVYLLCGNPSTNSPVFIYSYSHHSIIIIILHFLLLLDQMTFKYLRLTDRCVARGRLA